MAALPACNPAPAGDAGALDAGRLDIGDVGEPDAAATDAGPDGSELDSGAADTGSEDASTDAPADVGDPDVGMLTGVSCTVREGCMAALTIGDVSFQLIPAHLEFAPTAAAGLTSPLPGFQRLYNSTTPPVMPSDATGCGYIIGGDDTPNVMRRGARIDVDVHATRGEVDCPDGSTDLLIEVDCEGSTTVSPTTECRDPGVFDRLPDDPAPAPLACDVRRRDGACALLPTSVETPEAWVAPGCHSVESELFITSPALDEVTGADAVRLYQEEPCDSYAVDVAQGRDPILRRADEIWVERLRRTAGSCVDATGAHVPVLEVVCAGLGILGEAP